MEIKCLTTLDEAKRLWNELTPRESIYDLWDFRECFYRHDPHPLRFYTVYEDGQPVALMPLQDNKDWGGLEFFAEEPTEENRIFFRPGYGALVPRLFEAAAKDGDLKCYDLSGDLEFITALPLEDYKYVLPLDGLKNFDDYLESRLSAKRRRSLRKELTVVEALKPSMEIDNQADLEILFELNVASFAGESYLRTEVERQPFRDLLKSGLVWRIISVVIAGQKQAVSLSILYNDKWYYLLTGVNSRQYPALGKYLNKINMEAAIKAGAAYFDAGLGDCGWKDIWHFDKIPQYEYPGD